MANLIMQASPLAKNEGKCYIHPKKVDEFPGTEKDEGLWFQIKY